MALLIYMKGDPKAIIVKESMKELEEMLNKIPGGNTMGGMLELNGWYGNKIAFCNPLENWSHVVEEKDSIVKQRLSDHEKAQKEKQIMMNKSRNPDLITQPQMMFPRGRGRGN
jgi:hypothetical protein